MQRIEELEGKKIALIGLGASQIDYVIGKENSKQWDEVWCINSALAVFPCDRVFSYKHNLHFAEAGRACVEFWICKCIEAGIAIGASPRSSLLDSNVPVTERLYGYHRLADPLVAMPHEDEWHVFPVSKLSEMKKKHGFETIEMPSAPEPYKG